MGVELDRLGMMRQPLAAAGNDLSAAADIATSTDAGDRLNDLADQLGQLAEAETGPDHGRLARIQSAMHDLRETVDDEAASRIQAAHEAINYYREDLEGV